MTHPLRMSKLTLGLVAALAAAPAFAQSTSAGVGGQVMSAAGQPVAGAEVTITHTESGTVSRATTDASGRYNARGLRVGGPYTITITKPGAGTKTEEGVYLNLNQVNTVNANLGGDLAATNLDAVNVVATAGGLDLFSANKMGTGSNVTRETMDALPSANRNIQDYIRLDPRISQVSKADGAISAGGQNTRYNAIRIDGISASDPFGLGSNNLPTERQPVSMDAIQEINIDLANYDTTISGGTGAVINAVTKSGTNEFHGTVYGSYRDKDMVRSRLEGDKSDFNGFKDEKTYGMTFGGPILKDKLFFFTNYEKYERSGGGVSLSDSPYNKDPSKGGISDADISAVQKRMSDLGYPVGGVDGLNNKTTIEEYAVKLDWNINENHRAALRYNKMKQDVVRFPQVSSSALSLSDFWYTQPTQYETWMGELFSDWSENFSTEFKVSHKDYSSNRVAASHLPQMRVRFGNNSLYLGTEQNTHTNLVESKELSAFGAGTWYIGDHTVKFGFDYTDNNLMNFYGRNLYGAYDFRDLASFLKGTANGYQLRVPRPGGSLDDIPAKFHLKNTGLFIQDTWAINYNLSLMFGVRLDIPDFTSQNKYNTDIQSRYGYDNTKLVDKSLFQPRVGFNYTFDSDRPTQLRGGVGLFGGAAPNVWLAGAYQNTGLNYVEYNVSGNPGGFSADADNPFIPDPSKIIARQNVDIIAPGTRLPSVWKANLAFDHELPWYGIVASAEVLFTKVKDGLYFERLDLTDGKGKGATFVSAQDGRELYWNPAGLNQANSKIDSRSGDNLGMENGTNGALNRANRPNNIGDVMLLRNTDKGRGSQATFSLAKPLTENWGWSLGYTYTQSKEVSPLTSSQNTSNWNNTQILNANENIAYNSRYAIKDRITGTLEWKHNFFGDNATRIGLFYEGRSGRPYSYVFYNDANGDSAIGNDLFYVPKGVGDVLFTGGATMEKKFFDWLAQNPELEAYRGSVVPANSHRAKWVNSFDVRISQEFPGFVKGHKGEVALDIMNVGNLLNKKWGLIDDYGFYATRRVGNFAGIDPATGKYVYSFTGADDSSIQENNNDKGNTAVSRWSMQLTVKYKF